MKRLSLVNNQDGSFKVAYLNLSTNKKNYTKVLNEKLSITIDFDKENGVVGIKFQQPINFIVDKREMGFIVFDDKTDVQSLEMKTEDAAVRNYSEALIKKFLPK
jgi:hypothetical protein